MDKEVPGVGIETLHDAIVGHVVVRVQPAEEDDRVALSDQVHQVGVAVLEMAGPLPLVHVGGVAV